MAALTKTQLEHAKGKVANAASARMDAFCIKFGERPKVPEFTPAERRAMILGGTATIKKDLDFEDIFYRSFSDFFDYPPKPEVVAAQAQAEAWDAAVRAEQAKVDAISEALIDELVMSPDGMAALAKIATAFAN